MINVCSSNTLHTFDAWSDIFEEVHLTHVPLRYVKKIIFEFANNTHWELPVTVKMRYQGWDRLRSIMQDVSTHYKDELQNIEIDIDRNKLKRDVSKLTRSFLKKRKI